MAGKGAPEGNQYAKKEEKGRTISLYLAGDDFALIRQILQDRGEDSSDEKCVELAKMAAKSGVYQLVIAKKSENDQSLEAAMRETVDRLFNMVRTKKENKLFYTIILYRKHCNDLVEVLHPEEKLAEVSFNEKSYPVEWYTSVDGLVYVD